MPPHFAIPFRLARNGTVATVRQDTPDEIAQCVRTVVSSTPGDRQVVPGFGVDDLTFAPPLAITDEWVAEAVEQWEPRATVEITRQAIDDTGRADVTLEVDRT